MKLGSVVLFACGGALLAIQSLLSWTTHGTLSGAAPVDLIGLVLDGTITRVGGFELAALIAVPLLGVALVALAAPQHPWVRPVRAAVTAVAVVATGVLLVRLADLQLLPRGDARLGTGAVLALIGAACVGVAVLLDLAGSRTKESS